MTQPAKLRPTGHTLTQDRLDALKAILPEAFADGAINWETLREVLGGHLEEDGDDTGTGSVATEHFGLFWPGKRAARKLAAQPSKGTLIPAPGEGVNEAETRNLFIEGDNLEVLKLLQKSYAGRVKLIYIDPPYNTGNDFIYSDDFSEPTEDYLRKTGQMGERGELLTSNPKAGGRFHSNWLNMIYPRLVLARNLLREDGVIFVSIDDNEVHHLRQVMDEIFGAENFVAEIVWEKMYTAKNDSSLMSTSHEYLLAFMKDSTLGGIYLLPRSEDADARYRNPDGDKRGPWKAIPLYADEERRNGRFPIRAPNGKLHELGPNKHWRYTESEVQRLIEDNRIYFGLDGNAQPNLKRFLSEVRQGMKAKSLWSYDEVGSNDSAKRQLKEIFPDAVEATFPFPKPSSLIRQCLTLATTGVDEDELVLDFFAGSATTAQAVLEQNKEDGGNRRFILVQIPEPTDNPQFPTIAEIGKERIRRVIAKMTAEGTTSDRPPTTAQESFLSTSDQPLTTSHQDLGFKVLKLAPSHFRAWRNYAGDDTATLETLFSQAETPLVAGWQREAVLAEVMLIEGFPLDSAIRPLAQFRHNALTAVSHEAFTHKLLVCLDDHIAAETIDALAAAPSQGVLVCLDSALTDEAKMRLQDCVTLKVI